MYPRSRDNLFLKKYGTNKRRIPKITKPKQLEGSGGVGEHKKRNGTKQNPSCLVCIGVFFVCLWSCVTRKLKLCYFSKTNRVFQLISFQSFLDQFVEITPKEKETRQLKPKVYFQKNNPFFWVVSWVVLFAPYTHKLETNQVSVDNAFLGFTIFVQKRRTMGKQHEHQTPNAHIRPLNDH